MTGLVRKIALLGACGLFMAAAASAAVPDPAHSNTPAFIKAGGVGVGTGAGIPDVAIGVTVTVRDFLNNPISGSNVELNYFNCSDTKLCTAVIAGRTVDCTNKAVRGSTNASGQFTVSVLGASTNALGAPGVISPGAGLGCIRIYADGIQLGTATSVDLDENGFNGVNGADLSFVVLDVGLIGLGATYKGRSDFSQDGSVNGADLAFFAVDLGRAGTPNGSGGGCASGPTNTPQPYCP